MEYYCIVSIFYKVLELTHTHTHTHTHNLTSLLHVSGSLTPSSGSEICTKL